MKKLDYEEIDLYDLLDAISEATKSDATSFDDVISFDCAISREIYLGPVGANTGSTIDTLIRYWNRKDEENNTPVEERHPIKIYIDSVGGSLVETFTMIDSIQMSKTPVWTICTGAAYSGGFFTFIAGHKRFCYPTASLLFHEGSTSNMADAGKFRNFADFYCKQLDMLKDITIKYTNISDEEYEKHRKDDWWFSAKEALEYGICDEIATELI